MHVNAERGKAIRRVQAVGAQDVHSAETKVANGNHRVSAKFQEGSDVLKLCTFGAPHGRGLKVFGKPIGGHRGNTLKKKHTDVIMTCTVMPL